MNDYYEEFSDTIGELLGIQLAYAEHDLREDIEGNQAEEALQVVQRIAAIYRDFATGEFPGFREDFSKGYQYGKGEIRGESKLTNRVAPNSQASTEVDPTPS